MMRPVAIPALFLTLVAFAGPAVAADKGAPPTEIAMVSDSYHGIAVADPYRWLEDAADPKVTAWTASENSRTRTYLDGLPARTAIRAKLDALTGTDGPRHVGFMPAGDRIFALRFDPSRQQPRLVALGPDLDPDKEQIVLDPNQLDASGHTAMDWYRPSHDGKLVAVSLSQNGSEIGTLHVFDTATGQEKFETIAGVQYPTGGGSLAWAADDKGFWYTRYPGAERPEADRGFFQQVYFHTLGTAAKLDKRVLGQGFPKVAEIILGNADTPDHVLAAVLNGDGGEVAHYVQGPTGGWHQVTRFTDQIAEAALGPDGALYLVSRQGAPRGKVLKLAPGDYTLAHAKVIVPENAAAIVPQSGSLHVAKDRLYVTKVDGGPTTVEIRGTDGRALGTLPAPPVSSIGNVTPLPGGDLLFSVEGYTQPQKIERYSAATGQSSDTALALTSAVKFDDAEVERAFATSKDGTKVPYTLIRKKGTSADGTAPTLLYGYGGYGVILDPRFAGSRARLWLDAGGVFVVANIRGGGEYGEIWHQQGSLTRKQNVFDDFTAVAEELIARKITTHERLALMGGSNGGLLMGAVLTQHPGLARAVVSAVGIYDMLRVENDPNGAFNTTEFGTVKDKAQFDALYAYSPYHHVVDGTAYPAVLFQTGDTDGRVNPMQSRKMTARLQAATASDRPILLLTRADAGHGIGSGRAVILDQTADSLAFLFDQLGVTPVVD